MAEEELTLRMNARGARSTSRDVDRVARSVRDVNTSSRKAGSGVNIFSRAVTIMQTRLIIGVVLISLLSVSLAGLIPVLALLTAATAAFGGVALPVFLIGLGVMQRFGDTAGIAGSAASELTDVLAALKHAWDVAISPAASIVMRGMSAALVTLIPLVESLQPAFTMFAHAMASAMQIAANSLAGLGPELTALFEAAGPMLDTFAHAVGPFASAMIALGIAGMPVLQQLLQWLTDFAILLPGAVDDTTRFAHSATAANLVAIVFRDIAAVATWLASVVSSLAGIAYQLYLDLLPIETLVGIGLLGAFQGLADVLGFVNDHMSVIGPLIAPLVAGLVAWKVATIALAAVTAILDGVLGALYVLAWTNPITLVVLAAIALAYAFYTLYQRSETFRGAVNWLFNQLKAGWQWVTDNWGLLATIFTAPFAPLLFILRLAITHFKDLINLAKTAGDYLTPGGKHGIGSKDGLLGIPGVPIFAGGGVHRGGPALVHDQGPEVMDLPSGTRIYPNGVVPPVEGPGEFVIEATFVLPSGEVVGRQVLRASKKKKATR